MDAYDVASGDRGTLNQGLNKVCRWTASTCDKEVQAPFFEDSARRIKEYPAERN